MKKTVIYFCLLLALSFYSCEKFETEEITDWQQLNDFPGTPRASASGFVVGDRGYICLGRSAWNSGHLNDLWEYDSKNDSWTRKSDFPGNPRVKAVCVSIGTKAYIGMGAIGAYESSNLFSDFWEYDTQTDVWTQKASFPGAGKNDMVYAVVEGKLYTALGFDGINRLGDAWMYDPEKDTWTSIAPYPNMVSSAAGFSIGGNFYVGSGFLGFNQKKFYKYVRETDKWQRLADLPDGRMLSKGLSIGDKGYIMLGRFWNGKMNGGRLLSDIVEYDPASNTWTKKGDFPGGARQNHVTFCIDGKGYIIMGEDDNDRKADVWCFKP